MTLSIPDALNRTADDNEDASLIIELVFDEVQSEADVSALLDATVPDTDTRVEAAFDAAADRFFFVTFAAAVSDGRERVAFEFARALRRETRALEANPVLADSIYGAIGVAGPEESSVISCKTPTDTGLPFGWVHPLIDTLGAWQHSKGAGTTVAVIDTGFSDHQELAGCIGGKQQLNLVEGGNDASDRFNSGLFKHPGHGTLVASVVASRGGASADGTVSGHGAVTGAAPAAELLPIRAIKSVMNTLQKTLPAAIDHAIAQGADVIVMAQGGPTRVASTEAALRRAQAAGLIVCCAAGNCWGPVVFPAAYAAQGLCTAVAALTRSLTPWDKSSKGPEVTLSAPGENVWGAVKRSADAINHGVTPAQGTTLATSLTTGVAACWVAHHGGRAALKARADQLGTSVQALWNASVTHGLQKPPIWNGAMDLGAGVLNARTALEANLPNAAPEAVPEALSVAGVDSTANIALTHLANHAPAAAAEFDDDMAEFAGEILWLSFRGTAKTRLAESIEAPQPADPVSAELEAAIAGRPALRARLGQH